MPFQLPPLPYAEGALSPAISSRTVKLHHGVHHQGYVNNLNTLIATGPMGAMPLEEIVRSTAGRAESVALFNNASQALNHNHYWASMKPNGGGAPAGALKARIDSDFGGLAGFTSAFHAAALGLFGSGWAWLVWKPQAQRLAVEATADADSPIVRGDVPLLALDVWEHAYYLDHQASRAAYITAVADTLLNWDWAAEQFAQAKGQRAA